jgi:hypothetical protein
MKETIPEGWTWEPMYEGDKGLVVISNHTTPLNGYVTVSFDRRLFTLGKSEPFRWERFVEGLYDESRYVGHGWRQRLVDDAVRALKHVYEEEEEEEE